ncbi:hypothetical protein D3C81_1926440 [compost metagenome]
MRSTLPSSVNCSVPTCWPLASGAISGSVRWATGFKSPALPRGTAIDTGFGGPSLTLSAVPSQTRASIPGWLLSNSFTVSKFWKLQFKSFRLSSARVASLSVPTTTTRMRRSPRTAVDTRQ